MSSGLKQVALMNNESRSETRKENETTVSDREGEEGRRLGVKIQTHLRGRG